MKNLFLLLCLSAYAFGASAQTPDWQWTIPAGGPGIDKCTGVATDPDGNVLITGFFQSPVITFGTVTLTNAGLNSQDIFVVKYDPSGNVLWARSAGGPDDDRGADIASDAEGNAVITGSFQSASIVFGTAAVANAGAADLFVVKYDANGNVLWADAAGGPMDENGQAISTDAGGRVLVTGYFDSPGIMIGTTALNSAGAGFSDILVIRYDASGNALWARSAGGTYHDRGEDIAADAAGNVLVTGIIQSPSVTFGTTVSGESNFIVKYDASGGILWARSAVGSVRCAGIGADANGNVLITGWFGGSSVAFGTTILDNGGINSSDFFVAKYDGNGNALWARSVGIQGSETGTGISVDGSGNALITGYYQSPGITFGATTLTNAGCENIFVVRYDPDGNALWAKSAGGESCSDEGAAIATDAEGNVLVTGFFASDPAAFGTNALPNAGLYDLFVAKLDGGATNTHTLANDDAGVRIFPNPSARETTLQADRILKDATLTVYNARGEIVKTMRNISGRTVTLARGDLSGGIYFLRLTEEGKVLAVATQTITN